MQRHLYFDLWGGSAWRLLTSVAGIAGHLYDTVFGCFALLGLEPPSVTGIAGHHRDAVF
jgi:hypothetical protein